MKSIANQYRDLQEGRMSQFNFMRNLRMSIPQITNTTSFGDAVKILKNKGIITESLDNFDEAVVLPKINEAQSEWLDKFIDALGFDESTPENLKKSLYTDQHNLMDKYGNMSPEEAAKKWLEANKSEDDDDAEFDAILKQLEDEMYGERATKSDVLDEPLEEINEVKGASGAEQYSKFTEAENDNFQELVTGIHIEHECFPDKTYDEIVKLVLKNLKKDSFYYTTYKLTGASGNKIETMDSSKPEDHQMKFYTEKTTVDTARGMKKIKMPKTEEKKKLKEQVEEAEMRFKDLPADPEVYKTVKDSKGKIIKATNAEGVEFQRGDEVTAIDNGEKIKIADFKEEQGKIKALYNKGMFFATIDIDGLEAPKASFRPGVNIGGSMEKLKNMVREIMKEMFDGRDNIDAEIEK